MGKTNQIQVDLNLLVLDSQKLAQAYTPIMLHCVNVNVISFDGRLKISLHMARYHFQILPLRYHAQQYHSHYSNLQQQANVNSNRNTLRLHCNSTYYCSCKSFPDDHAHYCARCFIPSWNVQTAWCLNKTCPKNICRDNNRMSRIAEHQQSDSYQINIKGEVVSL